MAFQTEIGIEIADAVAGISSAPLSMGNDELMVIVAEARGLSAGRDHAECAMMLAGVPPLERVVSPGRPSPDKAALSLARLRYSGAIDSLGQAVEAHAALRRQRLAAAIRPPAADARVAAAEAEEAHRMAAQEWEQQLLGHVKPRKTTKAAKRSSGL